MPVLNAALSPTTKVPAVRVVVPVKVLACPRVWLAEPVLLRLMAPEIRPVKLLLTAPPSVRVTAEPVLVTVPPAAAMSASPPIVAALPCRSTEVPVPTAMRLEAAPRPVALPTRTLPLVTLKPPEKLLAPLRVRVPAPALVQPPVPDATPLSVRSVRRATVRAEALVAKLPLKVIAPVSTASPRVTSPPRVTLLAKVRAVAPTLLSLPPLKVSALVPKAASSPARRTPARRVEVPAKVLALVSVTVPVVLFVRAVVTRPPPLASTASIVPFCRPRVVTERLPFWIVPSTSVSVPSCWSKPPRSKTPAFWVSAPVVRRRFAPPRASVPVLSVVPPVKVLMLLSVRVAAPFFTKALEPPRIASRLRAPALVTVSVLALRTPEAPVIEPEV